MNLGFKFISILFTLPLIAGLLLILYLIKGKQQRIIVSSLFLLKKITSTTTSKRIFNIERHYFFDLLILSLLLLGIAGIFLKNNPNSIILIDNSFSMFKRLSSGESLYIDNAIDKVKLRLSGEGFFSKSKIYVTSPVIEKIASISNLENKLLASGNTEDEIVYSEDQLERAIEILKKDAPDSNIYVYTDKLVKENNEILRNNKIYIESVEDTNNIDENLNNISIKSILVSSTNRKINLTIKNWSNTLVNCELVCEEAIKLSSKVELQSFYNKKITLEPSSTQTINLEDIPNSLLGGKCLIKSIDYGFNDILPADNIGFFSFQNTSSNILLISNYDSKLLNVENLGKNIVVKSQNQLNDNELIKYSGIIYHKVTPNSLPNKPFIIINPNDNQLFKTDPIKSENYFKISNWSSLNPILQYLDLNSLKINQATILKTPDWSYPILSIEQGNILFSGLVNGIKGSVVGFELLPFSAKENLAVSILTLNLLSWTFGEALSNQYLVPNKDSINSISNDFSSKDTTIKYSFSDGVSTSELSADSKVSKTGLLISEETSLSTNDIVTRYTAFNFIDEQESDPTSKTVSITPEALKINQNIEMIPNNSYPLYKELAIGLLLLLVLEQIYLIIKSSNRHV